MYDDYGDYDGYRTQRTIYRCGGYASRSGHCGATDCETCYPGCSTRVEELTDVEERLQTAGYKLVDEEGREWEKRVGVRTHVARRDHVDGRVKAGQKYQVTTMRCADGETGKSYQRHRKIVLS